MFSKKLNNLIVEYPKGQQDALKRLDDYIHGLNDAQDITLTINRLYDILHPSSRSVLAVMLAGLVRDGVFEKIVRVVSPGSGTGIEEYSSISEVPEVIHDIYRDVEMEVSTENIQTLYKLKNKIN